MASRVHELTASMCRVSFLVQPEFTVPGFSFGGTYGRSEIDECL